MKTFKTLSYQFLSIIIIFFFTTGCSLFESTERDITKTVALLEVAINRLDNNSNDWRNTLGDLEKNLTKDAQKLIKQEVADVLARSIAGAGTEVKCIIDFSGIRIKQQLENIKNKLLNIPQKPFYPNVCSIVPPGGISLNEARNPTTEKFEMYGFDFIDLKNNKKVKAFLEDNTGNETEITQFLNTPTNYLMTLNIGGSGVKFSDKSKQIVIKGQTLLSDTLDYTTLYTIGVFQPIQKTCETKPDSPTPQPYTFRPVHTRGDQEFNGHGPNVWFSVQLIQSDTEINARIYMKAEETEDDWTTAEETRIIRLYTAPTGFKITQIIGETISSHFYTDSNHGLDVFNLSGPVQQAQFVGDTGEDNDAGGQTQVNIIFAPLKVQLQEIGNCAPVVATSSGGFFGKIIKATNIDLQRLQVVEKIKQN